MNAHTHLPADHDASAASRPRWLLPGLLGALIVGGLVVAGVVSLTVVLYAGLFGGMILMHVGGHGGHGGHGGNGQVGAGHNLRANGADDGADLSHHSSGAKAPDSGSGAGLDARARTDSTESETDEHDQHRSHGCH